jgi:sugar lactone lactonase YvrE
MVNVIMKTQVNRILHATVQTSTTLKRLAPHTLKLSVLAIALVVSLPAVLSAQVNLSLAQPATTVAASGLSNARQIATDAAGNIYGPDNNGRIVKITPDGTQSVVATGLWPIGVAVDGAGNVYATTTSNSLVKIATSGSQTTLSSNFVTPTQVAVDGLGNVYVLDLGAGQVDEVSAEGDFSVLVGNFPSPSGIAADKEGDVFLSRANSNQVFEGGGGQLRTFAGAGLNGPTSLAVDGNGNLFIADTGNNRVVELPAGGGQQFTVLSGVASTVIAVDGAGDLFVSDQQTNHVLKGSIISANLGAVSVCSSNCGTTVTLTYAVTASGNLGHIKVLTQGSNSPSLDLTLAGSTCPGSLTAGSTCTVSVKFSPKYPGLRTGVLQITRADGTLAASTMLYGVGQGPQIAFDQGTSKNVASLNLPDGVAVDAAGDIFIATSHELVEIRGNSNGTQQVLYSGLSNGTAVAVDGAGNLFVADLGSTQVLKITPSGSASTVATGVCAWGVAVDGVGDVFIPDFCHNQVLEVLANSGTQLELATGLNNPLGVALDSSGNLFIVDNGNARVVKIPTGGGAQTTIASGLAYPNAVAVDAAGNVFILNESGVEEVPAAGGSPTTVATASYAYGIALDGAGDLFIAATNQNQVVEVQRSQPPVLNFPTTPVNQASNPLSITAENVGNQQLNALEGGFSMPPNFEQVAGSGTPPDCTSTFSLAPGTSCNLSISFTPTTTGAIQGTAEGKDNSLNRNPATQLITLTGTGQ